MTSPADDALTWLHRLDREGWLSAARNELHHAETFLRQRAFRPAITHARRAAGMACNAVLVEDAARGVTHDWGRSYMEHLQALAAGGAVVPGAVQQAAALLLATPPRAPELVTLGPPDRRALDAAVAILAWARERAGGAGQSH